VSEASTVENRPFVGRIEEQKQFRAALSELLDPPAGETLPYVCLLYGDGGIGKTTLARRFCDIAKNEEPFAGQFDVLWIDWEDERKKSPSLRVGSHQIAVETICRTIYAAAVRQKWGRQFSAYHKTLRQREEAVHEATAALSGQHDWDEFGILRTLGADALARIIRLQFPMIGDAGEALVEAFFDAGLQVGADQAVRLRAAVERHLRGALKPAAFDHLLNPEEQMVLALARGLNRVARRHRLIVVLDNYELVDRSDVWIRQIMRSAGPRLIWIISDRNDLLQSRLFGNEYFHGYADDIPRRLLPYAMRPLAVDDIRRYFAAAVPERPLDKAETEAISRVCRGIPLAVQEAAAIWQTGAALHEIVGDITISTPGSQIVQKMTNRYLQHVVAETDRQAIFALALADGDVDLLRAMLHSESGNSSELDALLRRLERDYASVHAARARLHDDPAHFCREYLRTPLHRKSRRVLRLNERAVAALRERLQQLESGLPELATRCANDDWVQATLQLAQFLFWVDEVEAWSWLIPRYVEGIAFSDDLRRGLVAVAAAWHGSLSETGERLLAVLRDESSDTPLLSVLQQLRARGWLEGAGAEERAAILKMQQARHLLRHDRIRAALTYYEQVAARLGQDNAALRSQLADHYETAARHLLQRARGGGSATALLEQVTTWFPERQQAWYLLGVAHGEAGNPDQAIAAFQRTLALNEKHLAAHLRLGALYRDLGDFEQAHATYEAALALEPDAVAARRGLGEPLSCRRENRRRRRRFSNGARAGAGRRSLTRGAGKIYLHQGHDADALASFQQVLDEAPQHVPALRGLAEVQWRLGDYAAAHSAYEQLLQIDEGDAAAHLGWAALPARRPERGGSQPLPDGGDAEPAGG
jgi:tetratricopeptide (TPR) repeat protein